MEPFSAWRGGDLPRTANLVNRIANALEARLMFELRK
jgi:hypothetical protein